MTSSQKKVRFRAISTIKLLKEHVKAIRLVSPDRLIIADGNSGGNNVIPELIDLNIRPELSWILARTGFTLSGSMGLERSFAGSGSGLAGNH